MLNPDKKYNLEYYLGVVDKVVALGAHILGPLNPSHVQHQRY